MHFQKRFIFELQTSINIPLYSGAVKCGPVVQVFCGGPTPAPLPYPKNSKLGVEIRHVFVVQYGKGKADVKAAGLLVTVPHSAARPGIELNWLWRGIL